MKSPYKKGPRPNRRPWDFLIQAAYAPLQIVALALKVMFPSTLFLCGSNSYSAHAKRRFNTKPCVRCKAI